ncbi:hypothetical protein CANINC_002109 [Pichia inconspicua]|uniref:DUF676 domain-containing protein n=1 Tax=Pichia inconspicua TaxID=52247 RepID=A0A4T0X1X2_9ASCO|nr:hypothetical protein CANINC_002109 [[Candida] inconspicua]
MTVPPLLLTYAVRKDAYRTPRYPIVLCHGFSGFDHMFSLPVFAFPPTPPLTDTFKNLWNGRVGEGGGRAASDTAAAAAAADAASPAAMGVDNKSIAEQGKFLLEYWNGVKENLERGGCTVLVAKVPPFGSIESRAAALDTYIRRCVPDIRRQHGIPQHKRVRVNLVAHSMGGLDCRYLIHEKKHGRMPLGEVDDDDYEVASLTTISTPHRGTSAADFAMAYTPASLIKNYFPSVLQLTTDYMQKFNKSISDSPSVQYFSYAAQFTPSPVPGSIFLVTWKIVYDREGPNDGLVSVNSAKWGKYMGCLDDVDHADLINWMGIVKKAKMALGVPNFNPEYFYLDVADNLARNGL